MTWRWALSFGVLSLALLPGLSEGHDYRLRYRAFIVQESTVMKTPATASGSITVLFSHPAAASSPAVRVFLVLLIGLTRSPASIWQNV